MSTYYLYQNGKIRKIGWYEWDGHPDWQSYLYQVAGNDILRWDGHWVKLTPREKRSFRFAIYRSWLRIGKLTHEQTKQLMMAWWFWYAWLASWLIPAGLFTLVGLLPTVGKTQQLSGGAIVAMLFGVFTVTASFTCGLWRSIEEIPTIPRGYTLSIWCHDGKYSTDYWDAVLYDPYEKVVAKAVDECSSDFALRELFKDIKKGAIASQGHPHYFIGAKAEMMRLRARNEELERELGIGE